MVLAAVENVEWLSVCGEATGEVKLVVQEEAVVAETHGWWRRGAECGLRTKPHLDMGIRGKGAVHGDFQVSDVTTGRMVAPQWNTKDANRR